MRTANTQLRKNKTKHEKTFLSTDHHRAIVVETTLKVKRYALLLFSLLSVSSFLNDSSMLWCFQRNMHFYTFCHSIRIRFFSHFFFNSLLYVDCFLLFCGRECKKATQNTLQKLTYRCCLFLLQFYHVCFLFL